MIAKDSVALYARVSSESKARDNTIASQVTALRERIAADGFQLEPDHNYVDEGYSGTILFRPALERLRDAIAGGQVERVYVHAPDRLARRYAHQVLLIDEFRRAGTEVVFLNHPIGGTAEDDLLLQVQGVIAEYERAKISNGAGAAAGMPLMRIRQCADGGSLRVSLRELNSGWRNSAFRGGGIGSAHRSSHLCVDRSGANEPACSMPTPPADGLSNPARVNVLACLHDPRHAQQSSLYRTRSLRASTLLTSSATAAADPWASEAFAARHLAHPHAKRRMDRDSRSSNR